MSGETWRIEVGDTVHVTFPSEGFVTLEGVVRSIASATGECWVIEELDGNVHYIQHFSSISRFGRKP